MTRRTLARSLTLAIAILGGQALAQNNTQFIQQAKTYTVSGAYTYWTFTAHNQRTMVVRFAADYAGGAMILTPTQYRRFVNYQSFTYWGFYRQFGTKQVTIPAGDYYFVVSNESSGTNSTAAELDHRLFVTNWTRTGTGLNWSTYVPARGWAYERFSKLAGYRTFIDGCNSGVQTYLIPAGQIPNFTSGAAFTYFAGYSGTNRLLPGFYEVQLANGNYAMAYKNTTGKARAMTHRSEIFQPAGTASLSAIMSLGVSKPSDPVSTESTPADRATDAEWTTIPAILETIPTPQASSPAIPDQREGERMEPWISDEVQTVPSQSNGRKAPAPRP